MSQESKTPRTDAAWTSVGVTERNMYRLACDLETELAAVTEERDAFIASARIKEANSGWRTIETAPKDGTELLGWRNDCGVLLIRWTAPESFMTTAELEAAITGDDDWMEDEDWFCADFIAGCRLDEAEAPTHWMPLPAPPTTEPDQ